jgi:hypothetical protein
MRGRGTERCAGLEGGRTRPCSMVHLPRRKVHRRGCMGGRATKEDASDRAAWCTSYAGGRTPPGITVHHATMEGAPCQASQCTMPRWTVHHPRHHGAPCHDGGCIRPRSMVHQLRGRTHLTWQQAHHATMEGAASQASRCTMPRWRVQHPRHHGARCHDGGCTIPDVTAHHATTDWRFRRVCRAWPIGVAFHPGCVRERPGATRGPAGSRMNRTTCRRCRRPARVDAARAARAPSCCVANTPSAPRDPVPRSSAASLA